ncbi:MAG: hypothetical protein KF850_25350 [Labilithrix sp.]|nr:hypothetical protein [Labilithrix sp.]
MTTALADRLRADKGRLAVRVVDEMFAEDPFWADRYAARGRRFAEEDLGYHVEYLAQALVARDAGVLERYARWLQSVLTARGMCTAHLDESFARLATAIAEVELEEERLVPAYLGAARRALSYPDGAARALQDASGAIAARAVSLVAERFPLEADSASVGADVARLLAYAADALALARPATLAAYLAWRADHVRRSGDGGRRSATPGTLVEAVRAGPELSPSLRGDVIALFERGCS